jgi:hypothetical protein
LRAFSFSKGKGGYLFSGFSFSFSSSILKLGLVEVVLYIFNGNLIILSDLKILIYLICKV